ncbi:hypothetical protein J4226_01335 [Candidatus Pacearchaeota archaeon]|nr:hypothetical protein [Candidatus Pacearchaeota archaeon]
MDVLEFPNFSKVIGHSVENLGYSYLNVDNSISGKYLNAFHLGLLGVCRANDFLLNERGILPEDLYNEALFNELIKEDKKFYEENDDPFDSETLNSGDRKISILEYIGNNSLFSRAVLGSNNFVELSRKDIWNIISSDLSKVTYRPFSGYGGLNEDIREYCDFMVFSSKADVMEAALDYVSSMDIITLFQECQVLQTGDKRNLDSLIWEIYGSNSEIFTEDINNGLDYTGKVLIRKPRLIASQKRGKDVRTFLDNVRLSGTRDAFRGYVAQKVGIYDEDSSLITVNGNLEVMCFENQYKMLSSREKKLVDREEVILLRRVALKNQVDLDFDVTSIEMPFAIENDGKGKHKFVYDIDGVCSGY